MPKKNTTKKNELATEVAKKVQPKKVVKKVAAKKVVKKTTPKTTCSCKKKCAATHAFWINNGPVIRSIDDLAKALKEITDEQYLYHTKRDGNDFVKWITDCLGDESCAVSLKKARTRVGAVRILSSKCACC